ncbi:MAG: helix-turn-helix transcriptional regulator [Syntrophobacteraceae bacterium]
MSEVGERIRKLRRELDLTQQSFAKVMSISRSHIANLETGGSEPSDHLLSLMCTRFGISFDWLKHGQGDSLLRPDLDATQQGLLRLFLARAPFRLTLGQLQAFSKFYDEAAKYLVHSLGISLKADPAFCPMALIEGLREFLSKREGEPFESAEKLLKKCEPHVKAEDEAEFYI